MIKVIQIAAAFIVCNTALLALAPASAARANWTSEHTSVHPGLDRGARAADRLNETQVLGFFQRADPQSPWHSGVIKRAGAHLVWANAAGVHWKLEPDLPQLQLNTDETNPFHSLAADARAFRLIVRAAQVIAFSFRGEIYYKEDPARILGTYERITPQAEASGPSVIESVGDARFVWSDKTGHRWSLLPNFTTLELLAEAATLAGSRGRPRRFRLEFSADGAISGFSLGSERWRRRLSVGN